MVWAQVAIAYVVDLAFGDPKVVPHPVVLIGRLITYLESLVSSREMDKAKKKLAGIAIAVLVVGLAAAVTWGIIKLAYLINENLGFITSVWLISTTIATRGLLDSAKDIASSIEKGDLGEAKAKVAGIVGRDTERMKRRDVVRATIESVSENAVDGIIAPLIFAMIGGAPLAMAYKAVNTLDSMIGYKNERYEDLGWAAAKLDDLVNYAPARLSVLILTISAFLCRHNAKKAIRVAIRDGRNHASLNSGFPEATVAGAVGVKLGGTNYYAGIPRKSGFLGDGKGALTQKNINEVSWLIFVASAITVLLGRAIIYVINYVWGI